MSKYLMILIVMIVASLSSGCFVMKQAGYRAVEGGIAAIGDFAITKNQAALAEAVSIGRGMSPPLSLENIDTNDDGLYSEKEAWEFAKAQLKHEFKLQTEEVKVLAMGAIEALKNGDIAGAMSKAEEAKAKAKANGQGLMDTVLYGILSLLATAAATYKTTMIVRNRSRARDIAVVSEPVTEPRTFPIENNTSGFLATVETDSKPPLNPT